jgi:hypothetical protein
MVIEVAPNRIELSDLTGGYAPDPAQAAIAVNATPNVNNMLPEPWGSELRLRAGFARLSAGRIALTTHWLRHLNYYETIDSGARKRYLIAVLTNGTDAAANNIRIYAYDLIADTFTRIDTVGRSWAKANTEHWYAIVEGTYYGGTRGEEVYSWHPTNGWDATATTPGNSLGTWVDSLNPGGSEIARDYAFKKGQVVLYGGAYYKAGRDIRYKTWESGQEYTRGEKVSRKIDEGTGDTYWHSYECTKGHTAASATAPGTGADYAAKWKKVRLQNILDDDSDLTNDWFYQPVAAKASVGAYHGNRMWVRRDDNDNWARLQYSAPAKPERDALIADLDFDPTDWAAVDDNEGDGGGWLTIPFSGKGDAIRALYSLGNYLIIAGRWQSYVLSGLNESTWTLRKLGNYGATSVQSITELDGLVYMLGRHGVLAMTDGTAIQEVPGMEKIRKYLKNQLDLVLEASTPSSGENWFPTLSSHDGRIFISLPQGDAPSSSTTLVYDPRTQSWWSLDIPILDMATGEAGGTEKLWFSTTQHATGSQNPTAFLYQDDPGNEVYTDDDWQGVSGTPSTSDIAWVHKSAWFQYGTTRNERRLRKAWVLIAGEEDDTVAVTMYRNFVSSARTTVTRTLLGTNDYEAEFIEGVVGQGDGTTYATAIQVAGSANDRISLHGYGVDTEPVRSGRFHR